MQPITAKTPVFKHPFSHLVKIRYSCRSFDGREIDESKFSTIRDFLDLHNSTTRLPQRMEIVRKTALEKENFFTAGTYGLVSGVRTFIVGILKKENTIFWEGYGYAMHSALMLATDLGLNTLWIGGIFDRRSFSRLLRLQKDEFIPAIIALGVAASRRTVRDRITRWGSRGDQRKSPEKLFFLREPGIPLYPRLSPEIRAVLDNIRLGPSASNKQPWRIVFVPLKHDNTGDNGTLHRGQLHLYLDRDKTYARILPQVDLQKIDMGIAMFHLEMSARETGIRLRLNPVNPIIKNLPKNYEYVVSYDLGK